MKRSELISHLADRIDLIDKPHPVRVGIDGPDAAGKTRLADELARELQLRQESADFRRQIIRVMLDDFINPKEIRYDRGRLSPEGYYEESFNYEAVQYMLLSPLGPGGCRLYMDKFFDYRNNMPLPSVFNKAHDEAILLMDGVFLFRPELSDKWDFKVFLDVDRKVALERAMVRDRGHLGEVGMVAETYKRRYFPAQDRYCREVDPKEKADLVINNSNPEEPVIEKGQLYSEKF